jgi:AraC family ethanolamine operon transcriptional activator
MNARLHLHPPTQAPPEAGADGHTHSLAILHTRDADQQAESVGRWNQTYDQISAGTFDGWVVDAWFADVQLFREATNQVVHQRGNPWPDSLALAVPLAMRGEAYAHGLAMTANMIHVLDARRQELDLVTSPQLDLAAVAMRAETAERFCREVEGIELADLLRDDWLTLCGEPCLAPLRQFLGTTFAVLQSGQMPLEQPSIRRSLRDALLTNLFASLTCGDFAADSEGCAGQRRVVDRARGYLLSHPDEPVTIAELCRAIGVSRRKLQYCFQESLGCNPLHYLRALRLNRVRRELKGNGVAAASVQEVAARWGFWHLSHFAADYKHMFGELPSETLRRRRGSVAPNGGRPPVVAAN